MFTRRFLAAKGWRSHNQSKPSTETKPNNENQDSPTDPGDWLLAWQTQKLKNFEAFKKKIDSDPYHALFGQSDKILRWASSAMADTAATLKDQADASKNDAAAKDSKDNFSGSEGSLLRRLSKAMHETAASLEGESNDSPKRTENISESHKFESIHHDNDQSVFEMKDKASSYPHAANYPYKGEVEEKAYDIDPITLRKVEKKESMTFSSKEPKARSSSDVFDIPVKTFQSSSPKTSTLSNSRGYTQAEVQSSPRDGSQFSLPTWDEVLPLSYSQRNTNDLRFDQKDWLRREGFRNSTNKHTSPNEYEPSSAKSKIQTSLERHAKEAGRHTKASDVASKHETGPNFKGRHMKSSDVPKAPVPNGTTVEAEEDLFVRHNPLAARSRRHTQPVKEDLNCKESDAEHAVPVSGMEGDRVVAAQSTTSEALDALNKQYVDDAATPTARAGATVVENAVPKSEISSSELSVPLGESIRRMRSHYETHQLKRMEIDRVQQLKQIKKCSDLSTRLNKEIHDQKHAMISAEENRKADESRKSVAEATANPEHHRGEGDLSPTIAAFASRTDRIYKQKAPHARCKMAAKTAALVSEARLAASLRSIYEGHYGPISASHRQPSSPLASLLPTPTPSPAPPSPELAALRATIAAQAAELAQLRASPAPKVSPRETVKRTEPVFSGGARRAGRGERRRVARERKRAVWRSVLWTAVVTGGGCYAVGVAAEGGWL